jgi:hypothetical protein
MHALHVSGIDPGALPVPRHSAHATTRSYRASFSQPNAASSKVISRSRLMSPRVALADAEHAEQIAQDAVEVEVADVDDPAREGPPLLANGEPGALGAVAEAVVHGAPLRVAQHLVARELISLKRRAAEGSSGFLSGWCWMASLRKATLSSSALAVRITPRTS